MFSCVVFFVSFHSVDLEQLLLEHNQLTSREVERVTVLCSAARLVRGSRPVSFAARAPKPKS